MGSNSKSAGGGSATDGAGNTGSEAPLQGPVAARLPLPLPLRNADLELSALVDLYFAHYLGRDRAMVQRLSWWSARLGDRTISELSDDDVHSALELLSSQRPRYYAGVDANGAPIYKARKTVVSAATVNRYLAALSAVITWSIKKRIAPKGYVHPCRTVERRAENNERIRFLSDDERIRLLEASAGSRWNRLELLVLLAITTGARKGELLGLRWKDIDLERNLAYCGTTKNGDPKALPLVPEVSARLASAQGSASALVFGSSRNPAKPFDFKSCWRRALNDARIRDFRFHDLRHTCASMLAQNGATLLEIADVLGHRQLQMTKRYSHLTTSHKSALVNRVWRGIHGTTEHQ